VEGAKDGTRALSMPSRHTSTELYPQS
jgi:hypothetical protein